MRRILVAIVGIALLAGATALVPGSADAAAAPKKGDGGGVAAHWTDERMDEAVPRDLRLDARGLAYLESADGSLSPHGHSTKQLYAPKKAAPAPTAGAASGDRKGPTVSNRIPASGATIGASQTFSASVTDASGVRSVTFTIKLPNGTTQSFAAARSGTTSTYSA